MNSYVNCEKTHGLDALLSGYFLRFSHILCKKSGYLDHLGEVFLCFEIAYLCFSLFSVFEINLPLSHFYFSWSCSGESNFASVNIKRKRGKTNQSKFDTDTFLF